MHQLRHDRLLLRFVESAKLIVGQLSSQQYAAVALRTRNVVGVLLPHFVSSLANGKPLRQASAHKRLLFEAARASNPIRVPCCDRRILTSQPELTTMVMELVKRCVLATT